MFEQRAHDARGLMLDFVAMLLRDGAAQRIRLAEPRQRSFLGAIGGAAEMLDRFEIARIRARPFLKALYKGRARMNASHGLEDFDDLRARIAGLFTGDDRGAELMNDRQDAVIQLLPAGGFP